MKAAVLTELLEQAADATRRVELPPEPFEARDLVDAALALSGDLLDLVVRINASRREMWDLWAEYEHEMDGLDKGDRPPPQKPPEPPPPPKEPGK